MGDVGRKPGSARACGPRPRIAVVEDNADMRALIATMLCRAGYDVVEAEDGAELLSCIAHLARADEPATSAVALVVSDVSLPGLSGFDVLAALRDRYGPLPVILMTGFGAEEVRARAQALGAIAVLDKPFDLDELCSLVHRTMRTMGTTRTMRTRTASDPGDDGGS